MHLHAHACTHARTHARTERRQGYRYTRARTNAITHEMQRCVACRDHLTYPDIVTLSATRLTLYSIHESIPGGSVIALSLRPRPNEARKHARTHVCMHARMHARMQAHRARTHTHIHTPFAAIDAGGRRLHPLPAGPPAVIGAQGPHPHRRRRCRRRRRNRWRRLFGRRGAAEDFDGHGGRRGDEAVRHHEPDAVCVCV